MNLWRPWSLRRLVEDLETGAVSARETLRRAGERIGATEPSVRAWVALEPGIPDLAVGEGPLRGVPIGVKDIIDLAGIPTRCGSTLRDAADRAVEDAPIVTAWRAAGALPLGKTVTTEFAFFQPGPTRNPAHLDHTPGGSSSGSAAAVAAGHVPLAIGSQTAGSVTRPASYCGVASLVMRHGRYPGDGVVGLSPSLDAHGVFAATVSDLALAWSALTGAEDVAGSGAAPRIALWSARHLGVLSPEVDTLVAATALQLAGSGATVDDCGIEPLIAQVTAAHPIIMAYEAARERAVERTQMDRLSEPFGNLLRAGAAISVDEYEAARSLIVRACRDVGQLLEHHDVVVGAAAPGPAPRGLAATGDPILSRAWQSLGLAAVTVPGLRSTGGLPVGIQVIAQSELVALRVAAWIERVLAASGRAHPRSLGRSGPDRRGLGDRDQVRWCS